MHEICVFDINTGNEQIVEILKSVGMPKVYRNISTRLLDQQYKRYLSLTEPYSPIPPGSRYAGDKMILPILASYANITGFYFGISIDRVPLERQQTLHECHREGVIEIIKLGKTEIVLPRRFV